MIETVLLARPRSGNPNEESCIAAYCNDIRDRFVVKVKPESRSLLCFNFNYAWADFINSDRDLFVMQHNDVAPVGDDWLRKLRDAMGDRFDIMHAPCLIKDDRGITSTALGKRFCQFGPLRRIHQNELAKLPETFGLEEAAEVIGWDDGDGGKWDCLMPNTGCLMIRRTMKTIRFPCFKIHDNITGVTGYEMRDGKPRIIGNAEPVTESEDWNFGRWCARNGIRVGGTRSVITRHFGQAEFRTDHPYWADTTDKAFTLKAKGFQTLS